jgi:hypothetical protein
VFSKKLWLGLKWKENLEVGHNDIFTGYMRWIVLSRNTIVLNPVVTTEKLWETYYGKYNEDERSEMFFQMSQHVQLKTYSEANAEICGSVMVSAKARPGSGTWNQ